jgi:hypothetical protein
MWDNFVDVRPSDVLASVDARADTRADAAAVPEPAGRMWPVTRRGGRRGEGHVAGRVAGVWETADGELRVSLFEEAGDVDPAALEAVGERVAAFTGQDLRIVVGSC